MPISYRRLWRMLEKKKLSKTDLRNYVDISTATLAKLSADEVVALPVLEKICQALNCQIEDVLEVIPAASYVRWKRIKDEKNYMIRLLYLTGVPTDKDTDPASDLPRFLYGFSIACGDETEQRRTWDLKKICGNERFEVWAVFSVISGETLRDLIVDMEQKKPLQSFLERSGSRLKSPPQKSNRFLVSAISDAAFYSDGTYYRPEILLLPKRESSSLKEDVQPIHSPDEDPLFCEALVSAGMRSLYCDEYGELDPDRMDVIRDAFEQEWILLNGNKDLVRIGAFEVLSRMKEDAMQRELFSVKPVVVERKPFHKCIAGYLITVYHRHLKGDYRLEVSVYNAGNVTACKVFDLTVDGKDAVRQIDLEESSGNLEVRLFEVGTGERIELIGFSSLSLVREIGLVLNTVSRRGGLTDRYTRREKKADHRIEHYSSEETYIGDSGNDPWRKQYERVYEDFEQLYGAEWAQSEVFFHNGPSHEDFLRWLKKRVNGGRVREVYLLEIRISTPTAYVGSSD